MAITSRANTNIKEIKKLINSASFRKQEGLFVIEGARLCLEAADSGIKIIKFFYTTDAKNTYNNEVNSIKEVCNDTSIISNEISKYISDTKTPQGIFCICKMQDLKLSLDKLTRLDTIIKMDSCKILALENIQNPGNMGTIIRTSQALGIDMILFTHDSVDVFSPKVLRASMGGLFKLKLFEVDDLPKIIEKLQSNGYDCYASVLKPNAKKLNDIKFSNKTICAIGNEGAGLTTETIAKCNNALTIPMLKNSESLNVSVAAAIIIWEMTKL